MANAVDFAPRVETKGFVYKTPEYLKGKKHTKRCLGSGAVCAANVELSMADPVVDRCAECMSIAPAADKEVN